MKKAVNFVLLVLGVFIFVGCSNLQADLTANDWYLEPADKAENGTKFVLSFDDKKMTMSPEVESSGNNFADSFVDAFAKGITFTYDYTLKGKSLTLKNSELKQDIVLELKKVEKEFKLTEKSFKLDGKKNANKSGFDQAVLVPKEKKKDEKQTTKATESDSSTLEETSVKSSESSSTSEESDTEEIITTRDISLPKENSFKTNDLEFKITSIKIIPSGEEGNEFSDTPVIAFWYDITNNSSDEHSAVDWLSVVSAYQDNDPNTIKKLTMGTIPDNNLMSTQGNKIKQGGTTKGAFAYELDDTKTNVDLKIKDNKTFKDITSISIKIK